MATPSTLPGSILVVEDDVELGGQIAAQLRAAGFITTWLRQGRALGAADLASIDLVVLDLMLPGVTGMDMIGTIRSASAVPILVLSARNETTDKVRALQLGADDYMTKPFAFAEFVARVEALLRRGDLQRHDPVLRVADLSLDPMTRQVRRGERAIELTRKEYGLLRYLMENAGIVLSRSQLLNANWGYNFDPGTKVVDVYIRYLRQKIDEGEAQALIKTVRGFGYTISAD